MGQTFTAGTTGLFSSLWFLAGQTGPTTLSATLEIHSWNGAGSSALLGEVDFTPIHLNAPEGAPENFLAQEVDLTPLNIFLQAGSSYAFVLTNDIERLGTYERYLLGDNYPTMATPSYNNYGRTAQNPSGIDTHAGGALYSVSGDIWTPHWVLGDTYNDLVFGTVVDPDIQAPSTHPAVPEPVSAQLLGLGLVWLVFTFRKRLSAQ